MPGGRVSVSWVRSGTVGGPGRGDVIPVGWWRQQIGVQSLLFHELNQTSQGESFIIKLITGFIKFQLPGRKHQSVEGLFQGGLIWKEFCCVGSWQIGAECVDLSDSVCQFVTIHCVGFPGASHVFLL